MPPRDGEGEFSVFRIFLKECCIVLYEMLRSFCHILLKTIKQHATVCNKYCMMFYEMLYSFGGCLTLVSEIIWLSYLMWGLFRGKKPNYDLWLLMVEESKIRAKIDHDKMFRPKLAAFFNGIVNSIAIYISLFTKSPMKHFICSFLCFLGWVCHKPPI